VDELTATFITKDAVGFIGMTAGGAREFQSAAALPAELGFFAILKPAFRAFHISSSP
jgi:hypothetical protein